MVGVSVDDIEQPIKSFLGHFVVDQKERNDAHQYFRAILICIAELLDLFQYIFVADWIHSLRIDTRHDILLKFNYVNDVVLNHQVLDLL